MINLTNDTLADLPANVLRPEYDRSKLTPGIVHIGLGNFHRAHQAWYLHLLMQAGQDPSIWLEQTQYYGNLGQDPGFSAAFERALSVIWSGGITEAIDAYLGL